ncbi:MAG: hypothetical protein ABSH37_19360 [Bryobacteraceae bacterium]|jgi:hypothetical protein
MNTDKPILFDLCSSVFICVYLRLVMLLVFFSKLLSLPVSIRGSNLRDNEGMSGIQFVTDEKGRKVAVQINLKIHRELWGDIEDVLVSRSRRHEKRIPLEKVKVGLIKAGKLSRG